jgi:hypothetical protein
MFLSEYIFLLLFRDLCSVWAKEKAVCIHLFWKCLWRSYLVANDFKVDVLGGSSKKTDESL